MPFVKGHCANPAGRPKKPKQGIRPIIRNYFTQREIKELVEKAKEMAKTKPDIMKFLLEQVFGRAPQPIENTNENKFLLAMVRYDDNSPIDVPGQQPKIENPITAEIINADNTSQCDNTPPAETGSVLQSST